MVLIRLPTGWVILSCHFATATEWHIRARSLPRSRAKKRESVSQPASKGAILRKLERESANLDQWQKRAAIESPDGPQRIRGLAGSGKTIVLALKAAYLRAQHPDWKIAITFQTRSLYQPLNDLIRRFCFEHLNDEPNLENLRVLHAWGCSEGPGMYTEIARYCEALF